jgi:hypothetical protein
MIPASARCDLFCSGKSATHLAFRHSDDIVNAPLFIIGIVNYILGLRLLNFGEHEAPGAK